MLDKNKIRIKTKKEHKGGHRMRIIENMVEFASIGGFFVLMAFISGIGNSILLI
jgi:hypothetical protein